MTPREDQLRRDKLELMRLLAAVVDKAGGEVILTERELTVTRVLEKDTMGFTGLVRLTATRQ